MTSTPVRTRFAPSPTGPLHIGGLRTALFSWMWARHNNGQFILRIEDTDQKRFVEGSIELITSALDWLGIEYDEGPDKDGPYGPYVQSERLDNYHKWANWLVENGKAYKCFCSSERLAQVNEEKRKRKEPPGYDRHCRNLTAEQIAEREANGESYVIRFAMPLDGKTVVEDMLRGEVEFENDTIQDGVLLKSDGYPTYALAAIVDDHLMQISHVTRSNEWLPSYPYHAQIWRAFGWEMPQYAHLPVLLNPNGKGKMSKRVEAFSEGETRILVLTKEYQDAGYLPEAMLNFLINIGWNFGDDQEIFTVDEAIARFDLKDMNPTNSAFPIEKLDWLNGHYIRELTAEELAKRLKPFLERDGLTVDDDLLLQVAPLVQTRMKTLAEITDLAGYFFRDWAEFTGADVDDLIQKKMDAEGTVRMLNAAIDLTRTVEPFDHTTMYEAFKELASELDVKNGQLFGSMRVALTGQRISTPTFETMEILGREESIRRFEIAINSLQ